MLRDLLAETPVVLLDGAWGSALRARGISEAALPARALLDAEEVVARLAREYVEAGAQAITTNTFRASPFVLARHGLAGNCARVNAAAVGIARAAGAGCALGNVAPLRGEARALGELRAEDSGWLRAQYLEQAAALVAAGCRTAALETFTCVDEAALAVRACREAGVEEVSCSLYFPEDVGGALACDALREVAGLGADVVGFNCVTGPERALALLEGMDAESIGVPLVVRPNAGLPVRGADGLQYPVVAEEFAGYAVRLRDAGSRLIGGCCGTTPEYVAGMRGRLGG